MAGFLDPRYVTREPTDYRAVIDALIAQLQPDSGYFFGSTIVPVTLSIGVLGNRAEYSDRNTDLEQALDSVAAETSARRTHILIGDGRRSNPDVANSQFVRMRTEADRWIGLGGTFLTGASLAPFHPVANDPSGCRQAVADSLAATGRCPLYAFAFAADGDEGRVAAAMAGVFQHLFVWPVPALQPGLMSIVTAERSPTIDYSGGWTRSAGEFPIVRLRGREPGNAQMTVRLGVLDTTSGFGRAIHVTLNGQFRGFTAFSRRLEPAALEHAWNPEAGSASLVRPGRDGRLSLELLNRGPPLGSNAAAFLYRIDVIPQGIPSWLDTFDASDRDDAIRTYGLGRLFELFRHDQAHARPVARVYVVTQ